MIFDYDTLLDLFDVYGLDFEAWATQYNYSSSLTDEEIYSILPAEIKADILDLVMNTSWYHDGM